MGKRLQVLHEKTRMIIMGCDQCVYERKIEDLLVPGATLGCFPTLYAILGSAGVEQVITL